VRSARLKWSPARDPERCRPRKSRARARVSNCTSPCT